MNMTREQALQAIKAKMDYYESDKRLRAAIETLIPQLRESEDERIRKSLLAYIKGESKRLDTQKWVAYLEKQKYDRMKPIYDNQDSFESALEKAWKEYNDSGSRTVDSCEDDYVECAHAKGFREGYLFGLEKQKECFLAIPSGDTAPAEEDTVSKNEQEFLENEIKAFLCNYDMEFDDDAPTYDIAEHFYRLGKKAQEEQKEQKKQKPVPISCGHENGTPAEVCYGPKGDPDPAGVWKPSEEQMEALQVAAMVSKTDFNTLTSLLADLKKL